MFFLKATPQNCAIMGSTLMAYYNASGQLTNFDKSCVSFSVNTTFEVKEEVCNILGTDYPNNPGNYLGLPIMWGK